MTTEVLYNSQQALDIINKDTIGGLNKIYTNLKKEITERILKYIIKSSKKGYISDYTQEYNKLYTYERELKERIDSLVKDKLILNEKQIMSGKLPEQYLYIYVKSTNLKTFTDPFLLLPSYIGWKTDRPKLRHFVLPSETALTRDEFNQKNIEIAKNELIELYKLKVLLDQYIYTRIELELVMDKREYIKQIVEKNLYPIFQNNELYDDFMKMYKEKMTEELTDYLNRNRGGIGKNQLLRLRKKVINERILGEKNNVSRFLDREFIVKLQTETGFMDILNKYTQFIDVSTYVSYLDRIRNIQKSDIDKYIKEFNKILNNYEKISQKDKKAILDKIDALRVKFMNILTSGNPTADELKPLNLLQTRIKSLRITSEDIYKEIKQVIDNGISITNISEVLSKIDKIPYTRKREIFSRLDNEIMRLRDTTSSNDEKKELTNYLMKSIEKQQSLKYEPTIIKEEEDGEIKEQIILDTDLKNKLDKDPNITLLRNILRNINQYQVKQKLAPYNFDFDVDAILKMKFDNELTYILKNIIDINIQMRKIISISGKGQNIRVMLFKDVVELLINKIIKGRKLMATKDFYFIIKDVKWSPKTRNNLNTKEKGLIGVDKIAYQIDISLVLSIEGRSDTAVAFERKCNENEQQISMLFKELYGGLKNYYDEKMDTWEKKRKDVATPICIFKDGGSVRIKDIKSCILDKVQTKRSSPEDTFFEFSIPKIYGVPTYARIPRKSFYTGIDVAFPLRSGLEYKDDE
jgi:hypothetical protein